MTEPVRVLQVIGGLSMGGAETWLMELLRFWSKSGRPVEVDFLCTGGESAIFDEEAKALGARIYYVRYGRRDLHAFGRAFRGILRDRNYHAIHDHGDYAAGWHFALAAGVLPRVRVVHIHNPWLHIAANYAISPTRRATAATGRLLVRVMATHVCGTSADAMIRYGFAPGRAHPRTSVLHCGFDVDRFSLPRDECRSAVLQEFGWPSSSRIVLFAGRLDRALSYDHPQNHKNSWLALNIMREAVRRDGSWRLLMAGEEGEAGAALRSCIDEWGMRDRLSLLGVRTDIPRLMNAADVLLFPSRQEGLGMVAVEAQAASLPVVASTAVPGECVVVRELYEALPLTQPLGAWVDALSRAVARPRPGRAECRDSVDRSAFSIRNSAAALERIYRGATQ